MAPGLLRSSVVALLAAANINEADSASLQVHTAEEVMRNMTIDGAVHILKNASYVNKFPAFGSLLSAHLGSISDHTNALRGVRVHQASKNVDEAVGLLNGMMEDVNKKLDMEKERCDEFHASKTLLLDTTRVQISDENAAAAAAEETMSAAQEMKASLTETLAETKDRLDEKEKQCETDLDALNVELTAVKGDVDVLKLVLDGIDCTNAPASAASASLMQCDHCRPPNIFVSLLPDRLPPFMRKLELKSKMTHRRLEEVVFRVLEEAENDGDDEPAFVQVGARGRHKLRLRSASAAREDPVAVDGETSNESSSEDDFAEVPEIPNGRCVPDESCTLGRGDCNKIQERLALTLGAAQDRQTELEREQAQLDKDCKSLREKLSEEISASERGIAEESTKVAQATTKKSAALETSRSLGLYHKEESDILEAENNVCCENQNALVSEHCALKKIRESVSKGRRILDCQLGPWEEGACSHSCGGGVMLKTRSPVEPPFDGEKCGPMMMQVACNEQPCPIDCVMETWDAWSACDNKCDGGERTRSRGVAIEAKHGGLECENSEEMEQCNTHQCSQDCEYHDWEDWSACAPCGKGKRSRIRSFTPAKFGGEECQKKFLNEKETCRVASCKDFKQKDGKLACDAYVDVILLLDSSGSLGSWGWKDVYNFGKNFVTHFQMGNASGSLGILEYSRKTTWVQHLTEDYDEAFKSMAATKWDQSYTNTHTALAAARNEFVNGRKGAQPVIVVVTDGQPSKPLATKEEARQLNKAGIHVIWVAIGWGAPRDLIKEMAADPDDIFSAKNKKNLNSNWFFNKIIKKSCPVLKQGVRKWKR